MYTVDTGSRRVAVFHSPLTNRPAWPIAIVASVEDSSLIFLGHIQKSVPSAD